MGPIQRRKYYIVQGGLCFWCAQPMRWNWKKSSRASATVEHLVPRSTKEYKQLSGEEKKRLKVLACGRCNNGREDFAQPTQIDFELSFILWVAVQRISLIFSKRQLGVMVNDIFTEHFKGNT